MKRNLLKKITIAVIAVCMVIGGSVVSFAGETSEGNLSAANSEVPSEIIVEAVNNEPGIELYSNKHRNVKEVVSKKCYCREKGSKPHNGYTVVRKKTYYNNGEARFSTVKRTNIHVVQYRIYQVTIGNPSQKHKLYDEYRYTFTEYTRKSKNVAWGKGTSKSALLRSRNAIVTYFGDLF